MNGNSVMNVYSLIAGGVPSGYIMTNVPSRVIGRSVC